MDVRGTTAEREADVVGVLDERHTVGHPKPAHQPIGQAPCDYESRRPSEQDHQGAAVTGGGQLGDRHLCGLVVGQAEQLGASRWP